MQKRFKNLTMIKDVFPFLWVKQEKVRRLFLISFGLIFISMGLNLSIPIVLKEVVHNLSLSEMSMTYQLSSLLLAYGAIWTLSQIIQQTRQIIMIRPFERCIRLFCSKLFNHLHSLPMKFHLDRRTGALTNALERAQNGFADVFWGLFLFVLPTIIEVIFASIILSCYYGYIYGFILLIIATVFVVFTLYATQWASNLRILSNEQQSITNGNIVDSLLNFANIKYFNKKDYEVQKCEFYLKEREKSLVKSISSMELVQMGQSLIIGIGLIIIMYTAGRLTLLSYYDVSDFVLINGYILQFAAPLSHMGFIVRNIRRGLDELSNVMEIYKLKTENFTPNMESPSQNSLKSIEFKDVNFGYEPSHLVLKNINFHIEAGKTIGIVGQTGSGKSTIPNLLFKLFDVTRGQIFINNEDIQNLSSEYLSNLMAIVPQDVMLFNTTIYENILFARPNASKEEVKQAIKLSDLSSVLEKLPKNYNTIVGERGLKLSGGEKQRIAIARILLKQPSLYIFDEATSSLDHSTEETIMNNIAPILKNSTTIIIAHRLSTVVKADEILVLNNGVIKERGSHAFLLKQNGKYTSLWKAYNEIDQKTDAA